MRPVFRQARLVLGVTFLSTIVILLNVATTAVAEPGATMGPTGDEEDAPVFFYSTSSTTSREVLDGAIKAQGRERVVELLKDAQARGMSIPPLDDDPEAWGPDADLDSRRSHQIRHAQTVDLSDLRADLFL